MARPAAAAAAAAGAGVGFGSGVGFGPGSGPDASWVGTMDSHKLHWIATERLDKATSNAYWTAVNLTRANCYPQNAKPAVAAASAAAPSPNRVAPSALRVYSVASHMGRGGRIPFAHAVAHFTAATSSGSGSGSGNGSSSGSSTAWVARDCRVGESFGPTWSTHWFQVDFAIPDAWRNSGGNSHPPAEIHLLWDSGSEATLWSEGGRILQGLHGSDGADRRAEYVLWRADTKTVGATGAARPRTVRLYVEMACNGMFGAGDGEMIAAPDPNRSFPLRQCELAVFDRPYWDLLWDMLTAVDLAKDLPKQQMGSGPGETQPSVHALRALRCANAAYNALDPHDRSTFDTARALLRPCLTGANPAAAALPPVPGASAGGRSTTPTIYAVGHCHIDTAWLWPYDETRRKTARSWSSQLALMADPAYKRAGYTFTASQAQQFAWLQCDSPDLFARVQAAVRQGSFALEGGTWVECDGNLPSGESFARQFLLGQRYFRSHFPGAGGRCRVFWLPDTFGYSAQLPQLIRLGGLKYFLTQKLSWNLINTFPSHSFQWEGVDGTRVLTHFCPDDTYNSSATVRAVVHNTVRYKDKALCNSSLMLFGHGDGGGGPQAEHLERLLRLGAASASAAAGPAAAAAAAAVGASASTTASAGAAAASASDAGVPPGLDARVRFGSARDFFTNALEPDARANALNRWVGELYFELHRGTYTTQANLKRNNRRAERALRELELLSVVQACVTARNATSRTEAAGKPKKARGASASAETSRDLFQYYPAVSINALWEDVLLNQFHDVLPGSCTAAVAADANSLYRKVFATTDTLTASAMHGMLAALGLSAAAGAAAAAAPIVAEAKGGASAGRKRKEPTTDAANAAASSVVPNALWALNTTSFERVNEVVEVDDAQLATAIGGVQQQANALAFTARTLDADFDDTSAPDAAVAPAARERVRAKALALVSHVPAFGFATQQRASPVAAADRDDVTAVAPKAGAGKPAVFVLSNRLVQVDVCCTTGRVLSVRDQRTNGSAGGVGREVIDRTGGGAGNTFVLYQDQPLYWDAWDTELYHLQTRRELPVAAGVAAPAATGAKPAKVELVERGPLRATVRVEFEFSLPDTKLPGHPVAAAPAAAADSKQPASAAASAADVTKKKSRVVQYISVHAHSARIDFHTEVDWHELHAFLKVEFPVRVRAAAANYEIQFGQLQRPTHWNTTWDVARFEVCAQRWADVSEHGYGVSLLNDSKYGYACQGLDGSDGTVMRLSLLRASTKPDARADRGRHVFRYALWPHLGGSPAEGGVVEAAAAFCNPLHLRPVVVLPSASADAKEGATSATSFFAVHSQTRNVVLETVKAAEGGGHALILRLYEAHGGRTTFGVTLGAALGVQRVRDAVYCNLLEESLCDALALEAKAAPTDAAAVAAAAAAADAQKAVVTAATGDGGWAIAGLRATPYQIITLKVLLE